MLAPKLAQAVVQTHAWAQKNAYEVSQRGKIHRDLIEAYRQAP